mmetsp:Transcript_42256/g.100750  ORF Transcript_42256/g.100750 Transcript_42256/m.100750 type:complete len:231 (+) Transcript_42256:542-1234(+)
MATKLLHEGAAGIAVLLVDPQSLQLSLRQALKLTRLPLDLRPQRLHLAGARSTLKRGMKRCQLSQSHLGPGSVHRPLQPLARRELGQGRLHAVPAQRRAGCVREAGDLLQHGLAELLGLHKGGSVGSGQGVLHQLDADAEPVLDGVHLGRQPPSLSPVRCNGPFHHLLHVVVGDVRGLLQVPQDGAVPPHHRVAHAVDVAEEAVEARLDGVAVLVVLILDVIQGACIANA